MIGLGLVLLAQGPVLAQNSDKINELRQKRETLAREVERNRRQAEVKKQEALQLNKDVSKLNDDIELTQRKINQTQEEIISVQEQINDLSQQIRQKGEQIEVQRSYQRELINYLYEITGESTLVQLLSAQTISQAVIETTDTSVIEQEIEDTISALKNVQAQLDQNRDLLKGKQRELDSLKSQQEARRRGLEAQQSRKTQLARNSQEAQKEFEQLLEEARRAYQDVTSELFRITQSARNRGRSSGVKKIGNLEFSPPFVGLVTTEWGEPTFVQDFHTGLDIDCAIGDSLRAVADGKVISAGSRYGYGQTVVLDHGSGVTSLYAHGSVILVSESQEVKRGDSILSCGNTGFARAISPGGDGSHIHLELREDGVPVNPRIYIDV